MFGKRRSRIMIANEGFGCIKYQALGFLVRRKRRENILLKLAVQETRSEESTRWVGEVMDYRGRIVSHVNPRQSVNGQGFPIRFRHWNPNLTSEGSEVRDVRHFA